MPQKPTISLDFDGVLYSYKSNWNEGKLSDPPVDGAQDFCRWLHTSGFDIVVSTTRLVTEDVSERLERAKKMREWLEEHEFPEFMWKDTRGNGSVGRPRVVLTPTKPFAHVYIDDRGFRFEGDFEVVKKLLQLPSNYAPWHRKDNE